jgi:hypothetical protein
MAGLCELAIGLRAPKLAAAGAKSPIVSGGNLKYSRFRETATGDRVRSGLRGGVGVCLAVEGPLTAQGPSPGRPDPPRSAKQNLSPPTKLFKRTLDQFVTRHSGWEYAQSGISVIHFCISSVWVRYSSCADSPECVHSWLRGGSRTPLAYTGALFRRLEFQVVSGIRNEFACTVCLKNYGG